MGKTKEKKIQEVIEELELSGEVKEQFYELLVGNWSELDLDKTPLVLRLPEASNDVFSLFRSVKISKSLKVDDNWEISSNYGTGFKGVIHLPGEGNKIIWKDFSEESNPLDGIEQQIKQMSTRLSSLEKEKEELKKVLFDTILPQGEDEKIQYIPVDIYIDTNSSSKIFDVYSAVIDFLEDRGFEKSVELPAVKNSWFKRLVARSKEVMTSDDVVERFKEVEYGVEVNAILKQQSEIDKNESEALANILKSLNGINNGAIRIGSLLVVKVTDKNSGDVNLQVRTLSIKEMYLINKNPSLLAKPQLVLQALSQAIKDEDKASQN